MISKNFIQVIMHTGNLGINILIKIKGPLNLVQVKLF